jgi:hypothetical protein
MKNAWQSLAISLTALATLSGCGGSSGNGGDPIPPSELEALVDGIQVSVVEASTGHYSADSYIENAASFRMTDTDDSNDTAVSEDGKRFTAPDLNITITDANISYSAGYVDTATSYRFGLVGLDGYGHSLELNATFEVTDRPSELEALEASVQLSADEKTAGTFSAGDYVANATAFRMTDTDDNNATSVSGDGKQFTSADLNITIADANISYAAGNVEVTTAYSFGLVGLDDYGHSLELNATFEITDEADDAATVIKNIEMPQHVATTTPDFTVRATATDPGGMQQVMVELSKDGALLDTRYAYPDANLSRVDVNETFSNDGEGNYTVTFTAVGIVDGEGNRSVATANRSFEISLANDIANLLDNVTALLNNVTGPLDEEGITALLAEIATELGDLDTQLTGGEIDALLGEIETVLNGATGELLDNETVNTIIEELDASLGGLLSGLLG